MDDGLPFFEAEQARGPLLLEDDRTLRWWEYGHVTFGYPDLHPWPRAGCPRRSRFRPEAASPEVVATSAFWDSDYMESITVIRACVRATDAGPVIAQSASDSAGGYSLTVAGIRGPWVVLSRDSCSRHDSCTPSYVVVVDAVGGREGGAGGSPAVSAPEPTTLWSSRTPVRRRGYCPAAMDPSSSRPPAMAASSSTRRDRTGWRASSPRARRFAGCTTASRDRPTSVDAALAL